ncbi:MAG: protein-L-isoaspartate(D-aspartate) O-methyltransferase [Chloroflexota bacterium]|nr:protein-L-isoaspartate(D-aspartate) O-methyltransferase [Chloroflexota bacterium]MDE2920110.1 protein-L-isoaspartate(D-aspartate) O-methyltransferase [Chloroflexota bacterium]
MLADRETGCRVIRAGARLVRCGVLLAALLVAACGESGSRTPAADDRDDGVFAERRAKLMVEIRASDREISEPVLEAVARVDRHRFVRPENVDEAYENRPLPIGEGQTISQPLIVAMMTEALEISPGDRVLEIGTGSGYQAAVLAEMGAKVYSVEIIPALAAWSEENLRGAGYDDIEQRTDDGYFGWEDEAPFDGIIVTAAPDHVPQPLIRQLKVGGRMIVPVGPPGFYQTLWQIEQTADGVVAENLGLVRFVPLTGEMSAEDP